MKKLEHVFMRTLRHALDTECQLVVSLPTLSETALEPRLTAVLRAIEGQSAAQAERLEQILALLYQPPRSEAAWVATALLREAWEATMSGSGCGCASALLSLKRYELTLYEALLRWSESCGLDEALASIGRSIAEELLQTAVLSEIAFDFPTASAAIGDVPAIH